VALGNMQIPIPPLSEQNRIVTEIKRLLATIESLENNQRHLKEVLALSKSKILEIALSGKLIPQNSNDEPAIELLTTINPAYKSCDNRHYENVPKGWCFAKIKDIFIINPKNKANDYDMAGFVSMSMINEGYVDSYQYETREWSSIKAGFTHFQDGDIAVAKISPCLENRKSMILNGLPNGIGAGTTELHVFRSSIVDARYALYFFKSDYFIAQCIGTFNGVVGQQRVGKSVIEDIVFPLPPLEEQRRIACTISVIFKHLDNILSEL
jgi:type I restriction enzyme S subunit